MTTTDERALLRAIREQPDEDTPRLMLADVWEETDPARSELIRVQIETARTERGTTAPTSTKPGTYRSGSSHVYDDCYFDLQRRERDLLAANEARWRRGPVCGACNEGRTITIDSENGHPWPTLCTACWATGDAGGLMRMMRAPRVGDEPNVRYEPVHVTFVRGMKRVTVPRAADVWERVTNPCELCRFDPVYVYNRGDNVCPACQNSRIGKLAWQPTAWAHAVCEHHPDVVEFWINYTDDYDKVPGALIDKLEVNGDVNGANVVRWVHTFIK